MTDEGSTSEKCLAQHSTWTFPDGRGADGNEARRRGMDVSGLIERVYTCRLLKGHFERFFEDWHKDDDGCEWPVLEETVAEWTTTEKQ